MEDLDPRLQQAILDTNPSITQTRLFELDGNELQGAINAAKGKYFEYLVVDRLNTGEQVGDVILPTGYKAELAQSMTQPGWDLQIIGPDGGIAEYLQLKATDSVSYIKETLERYPDFQILATSEVARAADVLDSDINNADLTRLVTDAIDIADDSVLERFFSYLNPTIPLVIIAATAGYSLYTSDQPLRQAIKDQVLPGLKRMAVIKTTGAVAFATLGGWAAIPTALIGNAAYSRLDNIQKISEQIQKAYRRMLSLRILQQSRLLEEG